MNQRFLLVLLWASAWLSVIGCDSDKGADSSDAGADAGESEIVVLWEECPLFDGTTLMEGKAHCALTKMPMRWGENDGRTFTSAAKRILVGSTDTQIWLLHGGPGSSGTIGLAELLQLYSQYPGADAYTLDYRGTGYSNYLGCPQQESEESPYGVFIAPEEYGPCLEYIQENHGEDLDAYSFTQDAHDLAAYIEATREEGKKVIIWGGSGGTFWAQRFLQLYPDMVDGLILEGIAPVDFSIAQQDEYDEKIARRIMELCAEDSFCSQKLPTPMETAEQLFQDIAQGHCSEAGLSPKELADAVRLAIRDGNYFYPTNTLMPAIVYRLARCSAEDLAFLETLAEFTGELDSEPGKEGSQVLQLLLVASEIWFNQDLPDDQAVEEYLTQLASESTFAPGFALELMDVIKDYPRYDAPLDDKWADTDVPMLMLQGEIDPSTPHDEAVRLKDHFSGTYQHFVSFPYGTHNIQFGTPDGVSAPFGDCGFSLVLNFIDDPKSELDTSCAQQTLSLDFQGASWAPEVFGTADLFEN